MRIYKRNMLIMLELQIDFHTMRTVGEAMRLRKR